MATTTDFYSNNAGNLYTTATGTSYTSSPSQTWYYYDNGGQLVQSDVSPQHTHDMPSHNHGNWTIQSPQEHGISINGEEIMKFNDDIQMKIEGDWVSMTETVKRIEVMELMLKSMYGMLSPWQKGELAKMRPEDKKDDFEHFDPDLFKV